MRRIWKKRSMKFVMTRNIMRVPETVLQKQVLPIRLLGLVINS